MIDFEKAFNRINHNFIVTMLSDMEVPNWLLKIVIGFLEQRKLQVRYKGAQSKSKEMPGGGPAGTMLGMLLYIIFINPISFTKKFQWGSQIASKVSKRLPIPSLHLKYFDDLSLLEAINLQTDLKEDLRDLERPLNYHNRTGHVLDGDKIKTIAKLQEINKFAKMKQMVLNSQKTKIMVFNKSKKYDFMPEIQIKEGENCEVIEQFKILGLF